MSNRPWGRYTIDFIQRSLPLLGITVFLYIYARVRLVYSSVPFVQFVVYGFAVFLFCRWASDALRAWGKANPDSVFRSLKLRLHVLVVGVRGFAIAYIFILWIVGDGGLLFLLRLVSEAVFFYWCVSFLKDFRKKITTPDAEKSKWHRFMVLIVVVSGYTIAGGGLLLELVGYGKLALFWYTSWGRSLVVLMWAGLLLFSFREWNAAFIQSFPENKTDVIAKGRPLNWLILRLSWLAWAAAVFLSLLLAWGGTQTVFVGLVDIVTYPIQIGSMNLRLIGFVYATVILLCTHAATRLWGDFLKYRFLSDSGIELGLQQSITTVTIYLLWGLGILLSLNVMGLSTTSIAVVFGALSIGLGFGLQNIFNNFISGIILLFERPVQVGDVIQINDIWGAVTKINVRSTVVQTFDNASLIIPNSDLISNQVTNWSFKDPRLRRNIVVGVAYGSDIALVRDTLMEIAEKNGRALKRPKPDVLFEDFADSTLIFKLRVWSTVDDFVRMETEIRFEIDRLFKERNIEIAFPQLDVHVRSMAAKKDPAEIVPHEKAKPATVNGAL